MTEQAKQNTVTLDAPLERNGGPSITEITLRKPASGELRGTSLNALVNLDVDALGKVLPRISSPTLTEFDVQQLDPADLVQLGVVFAGFLLPKRAL
ncbi:phage tail assembly protein [Paraburkholderia sp. EG304]|uniref:phage tail assembly protein n=1 Tax=Paraburkholderia sp. EG304 TaxID=3237015 RepID=UPI00397A8A0F